MLKMVMYAMIVIVLSAASCELGRIVDRLDQINLTLSKECN